MKRTIETSHKLNANPEKVWEQISKASGVNEWLPIVTSCSLHGNKRVCTTEQGDLKETILKIDNKSKVFKYAINEQPLLPVQNVVGTMRVISQDESTELLWNMDFEIEDESNLPTIQQAVEDLYKAGASGLETISQGK
ncbi:MAG: SRPBCC family protein [Bacteroidota bacterium]